MTQGEKYESALRLLKELNCPGSIMCQLEVWGMFGRTDEVKLHNWEALSQGGLIEGEFKEVEHGA